MKALNLLKIGLMAIIMFVATTVFAETDLPYWNHKIIEQVDKVMSQVEKTGYTTDDYVLDVESGKLEMDCSRYLRLIVEEAAPEHYAILPKSSSEGTTALAKDYYNYIKNSSTTTESSRKWKQIKNIENALPGDIMVYKNYGEIETTGHVMVIYSKPLKSKDDECEVVVNDFANSGHAEDTREGDGSIADMYKYKSINGSGIGIGTMWIKTKGAEYYRWRSSDGPEHAVEIMIGRLVSEE